MDLGRHEAPGYIIENGGATRQETVSEPPPLTARFENLPVEHDGTRFKVPVVFSEPLHNTPGVKMRAALDVTDGRAMGSRRVDGDWGHRTVTVKPDGFGAVTVSLVPKTDCAAPGAICTDTGEPLTSFISARIQGPAMLSVADDRVREGPDAALSFAVTLDRAASGTVTVDYETANGSAEAGADYTGVSGTLTFAAGETAKTVTVWGVAGYGAGTLTLTPDGQEAIETDVDLTMAAAGLRGVLVKAPATGGVELAAKTDALGVRTTSAAVRGGADGNGNLAAAEADVTRLRLGLEGTWHGLTLGGGELIPRLEVGVRHDGGDAETGFGLGLGGGLAWSDRESGLSAEVSGRGLLTHASGGFRERGFAGALAWDPRPDSDRGVSLTMRQTVGVSATGGAEALLGRDTLAGLAANNGGNELDRRRLEMRLGYGLSAIGDRFTFTPELGVGLSNGGHDYSLGWRLDLAQRGPTALELKLEATRRERANDNAAEHGIGFRVTARW